MTTFRAAIRNGESTVGWQASVTSGTAYGAQVYSPVSSDIGNRVSHPSNRVPD